ncbi:putative peptide maturation dehydrogenase [Stenotrophomonas tumulicola]|uniref:putative peptide maturation dehydrogenase n=1 Tax=Stenotrophomonas tumulicola TaxID=1685415 RepID=UPI001FE42AC8|nr:putative peptide maturation dehydrogenase [Stenotrophomonas tumulicola]
MNASRYRRCHAVAVIPNEQPLFSLENLLAGGTGVEFEQQLQVRAAHLDLPVVLTPEACALLLETSAEQWRLLPEDTRARGLVQDLLAVGLLIVEEGEPAQPRQSDQRVRDGHWWALSAIHHRHSRWAGVDSASDMVKNHLVTAQDLVQQLGKPPAEAPDRQAGAIALPRAMPDAVAELLAGRTTCRNFDPDRPLPLDVLAGMLQHVLMAQAQVETEPGVRFLKKNVPSAGSLHPLEAFVVARNVEGLSTGIYHYHAVAHELGREATQPEDMDGFCLRLLSGQHWFASAHAMVVLVCRFGRNFWKYRNHAKAYRAVSLDVGHVSQALYTAATAKGLGAFVTAAINESEIESLLGFDPMVDGALAVCGFGWRADAMATAEFDPAGQVWTHWGQT